MPGPATPSFDVTIARLAEVCGTCRAEGSRAGYFPALYGNVTRAVRDRAREGGFEAAVRMEAFVDAFARRYLDAWDQRSAGRPTTGSWQAAFDATGEWRPVVLQHLLAGMGAHIGLDLPIVTAELAGSPDRLPALKPDFDAVNDVLASLVDASEASVTRFSPVLALLDWVGRRDDEWVTTAMLRLARDEAWRTAERLVVLDGEARAAAIAVLDEQVADIIRAIVRPGALVSAALLVVRVTERHDVADVIDGLGEIPAP